MELTSSVDNEQAGPAHNFNHTWVVTTPSIDQLDSGHYDNKTERGQPLLIE